MRVALLAYVFFGHVCIPFRIRGHSMELSLHSSSTLYCIAGYDRGSLVEGRAARGGVEGSQARQPSGAQAPLRAGVLSEPEAGPEAPALSVASPRKPVRNAG